MKIYTNPNFPRVPRETRDRPMHNRQCRDTTQFLDELSTRNAAALRRLDNLRPDRPGSRSTSVSHAHRFDDIHTRPARGHSPHCHRFSGITGTAIDVPGGHVHFLHGQTGFSRKRSE